MMSNHNEADSGRDRMDFARLGGLRSLPGILAILLAFGAACGSSDEFELSEEGVREVEGDDELLASVEFDNCDALGPTEVNRMWERAYSADITVTFGTEFGGSLQAVQVKVASELQITAGATRTYSDTASAEASPGTRGNLLVYGRPTEAHGSLVAEGVAGVYKVPNGFSMTRVERDDEPCGPEVRADADLTVQVDDVSFPGRDENRAIHVAADLRLENSGQVDAKNFLVHSRFRVAGSSAWFEFEDAQIDVVPAESFRIISVRSSAVGISGSLEIEAAVDTCPGRSAAPLDCEVPEISHENNTDYEDDIPVPIVFLLIGDQGPIPPVEVSEFFELKVAD